MRTTQRSQRVVAAGALALACAAACNTVLDIEDPKMRPAVGGEAGEQAGGVPASGGGFNTRMPVAGEAGAPAMAGSGGTSIQGGSANAGQAGEAGGGGGAAGAPECEADAVRCAGEAQKSPEICDSSGNWTPNTNEADGDCPLLCESGKCTVCHDGDKRCSVCEEGDANCSANQPQKCVDGAWGNDGDECKNYCDAGGCKTPTSCPPGIARAICKDGESCCRSLAVPGGTFKRNYDGGDYFNDPSFPAQVSPFLLDKFEVTVGRMRAFVAAYPQLDLREGDGKSDHIADDKGWSTKYELPADVAALVGQLKCPDTTWSDSVGENDQFPINCADFAIAYAFCIWDGGRLPTEAEWNFAAAGGDEQRAYPWKPLAGAAQITEEYAYYASDMHLLPTTVGSLAKGNGRWGQADLAGNVSEWTLDYYYESLPPELCADCLFTTASSERSIRGGSYLMPDFVQVVSNRISAAPVFASTDLGFRCARESK
jgi:formylglycine-generating enzyme